MTRATGLGANLPRDLLHEDADVCPAGSVLDHSEHRGREKTVLSELEGCLVVFGGGQNNAPISAKVGDRRRTTTRDR